MKNDWKFGDVLTLRGLRTSAVRVMYVANKHQSYSWTAMLGTSASEPMFVGVILVASYGQTIGAIETFYRSFYSPVYIPPK